jgi:hypothetical protein
MIDGLKLIEKHMQGQPSKPPLHLWNPELSGDIDIVIKSNGDWYHDGVKIVREPLVKLFASILRREDDGDYYLLTPVEKWRISVEDAPFMVVDSEVINQGEDDQQIVITTNMDDKFLLGSDFKLIVDENTTTLEPHPIVMLNNNLSAKINRPVFYRLADFAVEA